VITSNRTRGPRRPQASLPLLPIDYPSFETEYQIVLLKAPGVPAALAAQITGWRSARAGSLAARVAETLDWAHALLALDRTDVDEATLTDTLGVLLKYQDDVQRLQGARARDLARRAHGAG
jgi:MoxR-like ATPase